ncbi:MAG: 50S ribosomal protein L1 [Symbiobacteriaceae bacterium]|nr:50S ribosomal protein L1 [Symbiobacteriaceae bacterium]
MPKKGKKYQEVAKLVDKSKLYDPLEALELVRQTASANFIETVDIAVVLGVNPKHSDQNIRGATTMPAGLGRTVRVLVFAKGEKATEATDAGADFVGAEDLVERIAAGWTDFDVAVATPDVMGIVGRLGRILGPRSLMPNPRTGTVTMDISRTVAEIKAGKVEYRVDRAGVIHAPLGKITFTTEQLAMNFEALIDALVKAKPAAARGTYIRGVAICATMGPSIHVNPLRAQDRLLR